MAEQQVEPDIPARVCSTCCEPINVNAKKCIKCGSFQDWRRHLTISSTALALLIALISVGSSAVGTIRQAFEVPHSQISAKLVKLEGMNAYFLVANAGNKRGAIVRSSLQLHPDDGGQYLGDDSAGLIFVEPGESKVLILHYVADDKSRKSIIESFIKCRESSDCYIIPARITLPVIGFDGIERSVRFYVAFWYEDKFALGDREYSVEEVWPDSSRDSCFAAGREHCGG